ncbi:hypothetical protein CFOL_v3_10519 [Cephalotus follicularis]|uniref:Uncharacterized protein n=1 Tax=Cephalotus follicularis TaxID=3775 RepID=A0A1Q3BG75_CEPFO|nr:hypothetical protein CFOL_v3_10519 [Cephalotus follicularis]
MGRYYNKRVNPRPLKEGDLVLRNSAIADPTGTRGKLALNWEGPYKVKRVLRPGTFKLEILGGREIPKAWNTLASEEVLPMTLCKMYKFKIVNKNDFFLKKCMQRS